MSRTKIFGQIMALDTPRLLQKINEFNKGLEKYQCECFVQEFHLEYSSKFAIINFKIPEEAVNEVQNKLTEINQK